MSNMIEKKIILQYTSDPNGPAVSYLNFKKPKNSTLEEMGAYKSITLTAGDKSVDLSDLPFDLVIDIDKNDKIIGIEIIGNVIPEVLLKDDN